MFSSLDRSFTILCLWKMPVKPCGNYLSTLLAKLSLACKFEFGNKEFYFTWHFLLSVFVSAGIDLLTRFQSFLRRIWWHCTHLLHRFVAYLFGSLWWIAPISVYTAMFMASPILNAVCLLIVEITDKDVPQLTSATHHMYALNSSFAYLTANFKLF